jgi:acetylornithine deacetylase/succinyl-diaminopimelate desuccinylase-like protein
MASSAVDFARSNQQRFLNELKDLLRIPSVSTLEEHKPDIKKAADYVAHELRRIGMENVEVIPTKGHPLIYADWLHASGKPTVLCYAHYDVQPAEPLDEWKSPPFEPTERNNNIYARGAVDDKGQLWMEVKALEALMQTGGGKLPINVKIIFEGEEEVGGESIAEYIRKQKAKLKADFALVCDTELFAPDLPTLCVGLRGLVYTEIEAYGAKTDLHSGMYGGAAPNPFFALIEMISKMKDSKGKVLIPGFYKGVRLRPRPNSKPGSDCRSTKSTTARQKSDRKFSLENPATPFSIARGRVPRSKSTACPEASSLTEQRPSSRRKPRRRSRCAWSRTRIPTTS